MTFVRLFEFMVRREGKQYRTVAIKSWRGDKSKGLYSSFFPFFLSFLLLFLVYLLHYNTPRLFRLFPRFSTSYFSLVVSSPVAEEGEGVGKGSADSW